MNIIYNYIPAKVKEPQWFKFYNTEDFVVTTQRDYTARAASRLDLIPDPKCFTQEFLSKFGDVDDMMLKKKKEIEKRCYEWNRDRWLWPLELVLLQSVTFLSSCSHFLSLSLSLPLLLALVVDGGVGGWVIAAHQRNKIGEEEGGD